MEDFLLAAAAFSAVAALAAWVNARFFKAAPGVAFLAAGLICAAILALAHEVAPGAAILNTVDRAVGTIDFSGALLDFLLAFVLFAGGMAVNVSVFRRKWVGAASLAGLGTLISVLAISVGFWGASVLFGTALPFLWALVFGALVSPTDPVAVLSSGSQEIPSKMKALLEGEALFNDGVGIVLFGAAVAAAMADSPPPLGETIWSVVQESALGVGLGFAGGVVATWAIGAIDEYGAEILVSLAAATGVFALAHMLQVSGPIAAAVAGLMIGGGRGRRAMSETTLRYMRHFWEVLNEILTALIFLVVGIEVILLDFSPGLVLMAAIAAVAAFLGRAVAVGLTGLLLSRTPVGADLSNAPVLIWGGVRGAVTVALALALPESAYRQVLLVSAYAAVLTSMLLQAPTLGRVARWSAKSSR